MNNIYTLTTSTEFIYKNNRKITATQKTTNDGASVLKVSVSGKDFFQELEEHSKNGVVFYVKTRTPSAEYAYNVIRNKEGKVIEKRPVDATVSTARRASENCAMVERSDYIKFGMFALKMLNDGYDFHQFSNVVGETTYEKGIDFLGANGKKFGYSVREKAKYEPRLEQNLEFGTKKTAFRAEKYSRSGRDFVVNTEEFPVAGLLKRSVLLQIDGRRVAMPESRFVSAQGEVKDRAEEIKRDSRELRLHFEGRNYVDLKEFAQLVDRMETSSQDDGQESLF